MQGVEPLSGSRAILLRNNRARVGGAVYVQCSDIGSACTEAFGAGNKIGALPHLPKVEFSGNAASSYGNTVATKAVSMVWQGNTSILELVPGQQPLSLAVKLFDSQGSLVKGSEDIIEVLICPVTAVECTVVSASIPPINQGFNFLTGLSSIEAAVECDAISKVEMVTEMSFQIRVIGAEYIPRVSGRILCNMCKTGQRLITHDSRGTWSCEVCAPGTYNVNPFTGECLACPSAAVCLHGVPIFEASKATGTIEMELPDGDLQQALAVKIGVEAWQLTVLPLRRGPATVSFELVAGAAQMSELAAAGLELGNIKPIGPQAAEGEVWEEVNGQFLLRSCPPGHQLLNTTADGALDVESQRCLPCPPNTYIIDQKYPCQKCPKGIRAAASWSPRLLLCLSVSVCLSTVLSLFLFPRPLSLSLSVAPPRPPPYCPDGIQFIPNDWSEVGKQNGSTWELAPNADGSRSYRVIDCPSGFQISYAGDLPADDSCIKCERNTYRLNRANRNSSACSSCPSFATCGGGSDVQAKANFWRLSFHYLGEFEVILEADCSTKDATCMFPRGLGKNWGEPMTCLPLGESEQLYCARRTSAGEGGVRRVIGNSDASIPLLFACPKLEICGAGNTCLDNRTGPLCGYIHMQTEREGEARRESLCVREEKREER